VAAACRSHELFLLGFWLDAGLLQYLNVLTVEERKSLSGNAATHLLIARHTAFVLLSQATGYKMTKGREKEQAASQPDGSLPALPPTALGRSQTRSRQIDAEGQGSRTDPAVVTWRPFFIQPSSIHV
jgi:hypothetical protein